MLRFKEYLEEAKQVGVLYHFTAFNTAWEILSDMVLKSGGEGGISIGGSFSIPIKRNFISLTRNFNLKHVSNLKQNWASTRIVFDGNKLSNKYKIEPYVDIEFGITRKDFEQAEERIIGKEIKIKGTVIQVDILKKWLENDTDPHNYDQEELWNEVIPMFIKLMKKEGIKVNLVNSFKPVKK